MALPSNVFKTIIHVVTDTNVGIYTAPVGYTGVVLLAQVANVSGSSKIINFSHERVIAGIAVTTEILKDFPISSKDTVSLLNGKLALEPDDKILISSSTTGDLKFIGSILETLNG